MSAEQDKQESQMINSDSKNPNEDDVSEKSSNSESDEKDIVSLDALSQDELQYIVENSKYRSILSDLLSPFIEESPSEIA